MYILKVIGGVIIAIIILAVFGIIDSPPIKRWLATTFATSWCPQTECVKTHSHESHNHENDNVHDSVPTRSYEYPAIEPEPYDHVFENKVTWLALNMYFFRGETNDDRGKKGLTAVVFNRMTDRTQDFGRRTIRGIITHGYVPGECTCAFAWYCDGEDDTPYDLVRYAHDRKLARKWLRQFHEGTFEDPTYGATWFIYKFNEYPSSWHELEYTIELGEYAFYR